MAVAGCPAIEPKDKPPHASSANAQQDADKPSKCYCPAPKCAPLAPNCTQLNVRGS
jgi:hypothetical protein